MLCSTSKSTSIEIAVSCFTHVIDEFVLQDTV